MAGRAGLVPSGLCQGAGLDLDEDCREGRMGDQAVWSMEGDRCVDGYDEEYGY